MWTSLLFFTTGLIFLLPLLPALLELRLKQDVSPVRVEQDNAGNVDYFAESFMSFVTETIDDYQSGRQNALFPKFAYLLDHDGNFKPDDKEKKSLISKRLIIGLGQLGLPNGYSFNQEVFSNKDIQAGSNNRIRSVLALGDLWLGANSELLRWAHARNIYISEKCILLGRVSADDLIRFDINCVFTRVNANKVSILDCKSTDKGVSNIKPEATPKRETVESLRNHLDNSGRALLDDDLDFPEHGFWQGDIIVRGNARVRQYAEIRGSIKVYGQLQIESGAHISGTIVCNNHIHIGNSCILNGPIVAEKQIDIDAHSHIGNANSLTTVSAPTIRLVSGVTIFGTVWAKVRGETLSSLATTANANRQSDYNSG